MKTKNAINEMLLQADDFLTRKNIAEAKGLLEQVDPGNMPGFDFNYFSLLKIEIALFEGALDDNSDLIWQCIDYFRSSTNHDMFARSKYLCGWFLQVKGEWHDAQESLTESYLTYLRFDNLRAASRTLNRLALLQFQMGSIRDAIRSLEKCIKISLELGLDQNAVILKRNIALMLFRAGHINEAIHTFQLLSGSEHQSLTDKIQFNSTFGIIWAIKGDLIESGRLFGLIPNAQFELPRDHAIYLEYFGWLKLLEGKLSEAEKNLTEAVNMGLRLAPESDLVSQTKRLLADVYIAQKRFPEAAQTAREALAVASKIGERAEIAGAYRALAQCAHHEGNAVEAREHYFQALDIYQTIDYRYELAITRYLAAVSGLYDKTESSAMLYLAGEYFRSEQIAGWLARVEQARNKFPNPQGAGIKTAESKSEITFIAIHPLTLKALETAETIAPTDMTILLTGPTGTGKDCLAEYIHHRSGRTGQFISLNCAAIPDSMIETELFGHCRGAFTGAGSERVGLFEAAHGGTLYLNEIADASSEFQVKLLQAIENKIIRRIGTNESRSIDIRILAATNQDLKELISARRFRPDLYYRLNEVVISLPALVDRTEDIPALARYFLEEWGLQSSNGDSPLHRICDFLAERPWPGNVRELKAEIRRLWSVSGGNLEKINDILTQETGTSQEKFLQVLRENNGNKSATARELGVSEATVRNHLKRYNFQDQTL